jgi:DNA-binding MarR family transcriptional regulator
VIEVQNARASAPDHLLGRHNLGFLLAKASQRWNELLYERFVAAGFAEVRPSYGSILVPLYEEDGLRMGEIARRARLSKQTMTTMIRLLERDGLVERRPDPRDGRAYQIFLSPRAHALRPVAAAALADLEAEADSALPAHGVARLIAALRLLMDLVTPP